MLAMDNAARLDEDYLIARYRALQQRTAALDDQVPACLQRIAGTLCRIGGESDLAIEYRSRLVVARGHAMRAIKSHHQAIPFLQRAESLVDQLNRRAVSFEGAEWRDALLSHISALVETVESMLAESEGCFSEAQQVDPDAVPQSILDVQ
jgi:hypothetical protein